MALDSPSNSALKESRNGLVIFDKKINAAIINNVLKMMAHSQQDEGLFYHEVKIGSGKSAQTYVCTILVTKRITKTTGDNTPTDWEFHRIDASDLSTVLGEGGQGRVMQALNLVTGNLAALKVHFQKSMTFEEDLIKERRNLGMAGKLYGQTKVMLDLPPLGINLPHQAPTHTPTEYEVTLMEYNSGVNLIDFLYETDKSKDKESAEYFVKKKPLTVKEKANLVLQALQQVHWLHQDNNLLHKDLKTENFVLKGARFALFSLRLIDFGSGLIYLGENNASNEKDNSKPGNTGYIAPEMLQDTKDCPYFDKACDYWSLGVVIAEILSDFNFQAALRKAVQDAKSKDSLMSLKLDKNFIVKAMPDVICDNTRSKCQDPEDQMLWNELTSVVSLLTDEREARRELDIFKFIDRLRHLFLKKSHEFESSDSVKLKPNLRELRKRNTVRTFSAAASTVSFSEAESTQQTENLSKTLKRSSSTKRLRSKSKIDTSKTNSGEKRENTSPNRPKDQSDSAKKRNLVPAVHTELSESLIEEMGDDLTQLDLNKPDALPLVANPVTDQLLTTLSEMLSSQDNSFNAIPQPRRSLLLQQLSETKRSSGNFSELRANLEMLSDITQGTSVENDVQKVRSTLYSN